MSNGGSYDWLLAVFLAAAASFISNAGVTMQKLHHIRNQRNTNGNNNNNNSNNNINNTINNNVNKDNASVSPSVHYTSGWTWRFGLILVILGSLADFAALSYGSQSLVAPLGSLTLVSNAVL